jgi:hypothetical protein
MRTRSAFRARLARTAMLFSVVPSTAAISPSWPTRLRLRSRSPIYVLARTMRSGRVEPPCTPAGAHVPTRHLSDCLGIGVRAVQSLRTLPREPAVIRAVEKQARLRAVAENVAPASSG